METKLPNNSDSALSEVRENNRVVNKPVISTKAKHRATFGKLLRQTFIPEDVSDAKDYILADIVMPAMKNGIFDTIMNIVDYWRGGGGSYRRPGNVAAPRPRLGPQYDYSARSRNTPVRQENISLSRYSYDDIIIEDYPSNQGGSAAARADAEAVLVSMQSTIDRYTIVRISDLYDFVGLTSASTDYNYGWRSLEGATTRRVNGGWHIVLPKPMPIE